MRPASGTGSGRRYPFNRLKMPVLAPMPSASVSTALSANAGARRIWRNAKRTSWPIDDIITSPDPDPLGGRPVQPVPRFHGKGIEEGVDVTDGGVRPQRRGQVG